MNGVHEFSPADRKLYLRFVFSLMVVGALAFAVRSLAQTSPGMLEPTHRIGQYMQAINELGPLPFNGVFLVAKDGKIVATHSYGMADFEFQIPNGPETGFRIASLTKPITATAIMLLVEDGKLSVNDPIHKHNGER